MYKYLIVIITLTLLIILRIFLRKSSKKIQNYEIKKTPKNTIRQPIVYKYAGYAVCFGFIVLAILCFIFGGSMLEALLATLIVFIPLSFSGILMILYEKNWSITVNTDSFIFKNMFGKVKNFNFDEVTTKDINNGYRVYKDGKYIFGIGYFQVNSLELSEAMFKYNKKQKNKN